MPAVETWDVSSDSQDDMPDPETFGLEDRQKRTHGFPMLAPRGLVEKVASKGPSEEAPSGEVASEEADSKEALSDEVASEDVASEEAPSEEVPSSTGR